ncbi:DNA internalization-related competence protein ComEC/Rec2 [Jeongeupia naejangsanensis]|uniref:DNA internalization-related competence protein ComEC/Rec2 n=1 Tax=Jeongeupia naejangsanensis TaxID=613195 RepID=A0ABS2BMQ9_9NEIS|nr:DNA internalization-related competence protein ComEC/Rec2 [Jeongeupia naejangsanensis]MBM3116904.1 DNA internalization-related competence protein ComEC/Rec2 [Jeongeupia naejangsanensis]
MPTCLILVAFVAGVCALQPLSALPPLWLPLFVMAITLVPLLGSARWRPGAALVLALGLGFGYADLRAQWRLADRLPAGLEQRTAVADGYITDLPQHGQYGWRFTFAVTNSDPPGLPARVQVSSYGDRLQPQAGERWRLTLKPKRPHGLANPGGFDLERWLLGENIGATASVKAAERLPGHAWQAGIARLREALRNRLLHQLGNAPYTGVIVALAVGDQGGVPKEQWQRFAATGVTHLISVSGLHITLWATLLGALVNAGWRRMPRLVARIPAQRAALVAGVLAALGYSMLSGLSVPTQRTLLMLLIAAVGLWRGQSSAPLLTWLLALGVVVLIDPFATLSVGFWLSFLTVGALLYAGAATLGESPRWHGWVAAQWIATLASFPILALVFQQLPLISPLANALAIPLVSMIVTPLSLVGVLDPTGTLPWLAECAFALTDRWLQLCAHAPVLTMASPPFWTWLPATLGVVLWLSPRGVAGRLYAPVLLLPLAVPASTLREPGTFRATVIDVGQGLAVLVQTRTHTLLYDTGPPAATDRALLPTLRALGIRRLDLLTVSHNDNDHSGGAEAVLQGFGTALLHSTLPADHPARQLGTRHVGCTAGQSWQWDGVRFDVLWPAAGVAQASDNASSCTLRISTPSGHALLLAGDLGRNEELELVSRGLPATDLVVAPHHGSRSSSSQSLIDATAPQWVVFSAGYLNRFHHPHPSIVERYADAGARVLRTDDDGAITLDVGRAVQTRRWRADHQAYWSADRSDALSLPDNPGD